MREKLNSNIHWKLLTLRTKKEDSVECLGQCVSGNIKGAEHIMKMKSADSGENLIDLLKKTQGSSLSSQEFCQRCLDTRYEKGSVAAYVELHIEQGPVLEQMKEQIV